MDHRRRAGRHLRSDGLSGRIVVDGYSEKWLRRGFPWVYPKEVTKGERVFAGAEAVIVGLKGEVLGRGLLDQGWIAARVFRHDDGPLDRAWLAGVVDRALALRAMVIDDKTTGYRLIHAENDGLPGIRVDRWGDRLVIALDSPAVRPLIDPLVELLIERLGPVGVHLCYRPDKRDTIDRASMRGGLLYGAPAEGPTEVTERGLRFRVYPDEGPDVGLYPDMRATRLMLEPLWKGRRVLNTFAFTGAFGVAALAHGAASVVNVDLSQKYLDRARDNFSLNGLLPGDDAFVAEDTFKALDRFRRKSVQFDVVVLDPPSFSHGEGMFSAERDTVRLVAAAARVLAKDGLLLAPEFVRRPFAEVARGEQQAVLREHARGRGDEAHRVALGGEHALAVAEARRVEHDHIELDGLAAKPIQRLERVFGDERVIAGEQPVEREVVLRARQVLL